MEGLWMRVRVTGPLLPYVPGFADNLAQRGYAERTADETVRLVSHLSRWLSRQGFEATRPVLAPSSPARWASLAKRLADAQSSLGVCEVVRCHVWLGRLKAR